jgi:hypothetical protein
MQEYTAVIAGKVVQYPKAATFIVEQKQGHRPYKLLAHKADLDSALAKFQGSVTRGKTTRLSAVVGGFFKPLYRRTS